MARSTYIYIAFNNAGKIIVTGTVKREVIAFVKAYRDSGKAFGSSSFSKPEVSIASYRDGRGDAHGFLDLEKELS